MGSKTLLSFQTLTFLTELSGLFETQALVLLLQAVVNHEGLVNARHGNPLNGSIL